MDKSLSNIEIVTIAVFLLGGYSSHVDTEDIAVKANELAPGRFTWKKYPDQINIDNIRKRLSDAKKTQKGGYIVGSFNDGWLLTEKGLEFSKKMGKNLKNIEISREPINKKEMAWQRREKDRMMASSAYTKATAKELEEIKTQEAEAFFRLDDYVTGKARETKIIKYLNAFIDDPDLGVLIKQLAEKVRKNES
jgi:hypothetical protein